MTVTLQRILTSEFPSWLDRSCTEYVGDLVTQGGSREEAQRTAAETIARSFPDGAPSPGNEVFHVMNEAGAAVGYLWIGQDVSADPGAWWVWDVVINADQRGQGFGRAAMLLGEEYARSQGAHSLGLSVFGFNTGARGLYNSLGYETTSVKMLKTLI
ncbi:N-acetyltransferase [Cryobacterium sp. TMS1-13-1]|uniref:GNAT family N-acetyltransferase n=1 Tax=Cryobacterium sp. TMS1-13-1 TaxID=1259220 RepID=UPI00106BD0B0|nr:GNAT family N-acetyltransferase [Cryobacterium sp. TMS1-13-1]TFD21100.1 GNAT family N-acetyltransferase [Cryobacterium sp. TMS1-13-1]